MDVAERIYQLRKANNMTQEEFAKELYVCRSAVAKWETGKDMPGVDSLQMISARFHIRVHDLLGLPPVTNDRYKD